MQLFRHKVRGHDRDYHPQSSRKAQRSFNAAGRRDCGDFQIGFARERIRVVVLRAPPGMRIWSSGHDVRELPEGGRDPLGWDDPLRYFVRAIEECPAPVIAMIEGGVWGGACEVAFACDLIIAAPNATFAVTPARLGVPYNVTGMLTLLNAGSARVVKEMAFTARPVSAERAERLGIRRMPYLLDLSGATMAI